MIKHIIFDVDKTIYPDSCGFGDEMDRRISEYTANFIGKPLSEVDILRKQSVKDYGTTLRWLQLEHGLTDTDHYLDFVHPVDVEKYLPNKNEVKNIFHKIKVPISILSNGPMENVDRILHFYEVKDLFNPIIDIKMNQLKGKPYTEVYERILKIIGLPIEEVLLVDDVEDYLIPFHDMGGNVLLVNEHNRPTKMNFNQIRNILELPPEYLT
ncbi:MAG: HAD hydrolase-like protein [Spirochaetales bacterium]|nr:HAD hydrolase-like protein [Spirochaetales bacterium]